MMDSSHESFSFDFGPFEEVHSWRKLPDCDEFVGDRRSKHTLVHYQGSLYVFGGDNGKSMLNDLLRFDTTEKSWGRALVNGEARPAPRYHHSAVVYESSMFVFGGYTGDLHSNSNLTNRNDLWEYKFNTGQWTMWCAGSTGPRPVPRSAHGSAVTPDGKLVIFAGYEGNVRLNDMWEIDLKTPMGGSTAEAVWREVPYVGEAPPTCCNFPVAVTSQSMYVFSGSIGAPKKSALLSDLFQYEFESKTWTRISTEHVLRGKGSDGPVARRYGHTMVCHQGKLYVFGGAAKGYKALPNEVHCFDLDTETWSATEFPPSGSSRESVAPTGRLFHASAVVGDAMYIFGGTVVDSKHRSGEIFKFQMTNLPKCTLHDDFGRLLSSGQLSDVDFEVKSASGTGRETIPAHVALVAARSQFLRRKVVEAQRDAPPGEKLRVCLPEVDENAFNLLLEFIYTDKIDPTAGDRSMAGSDIVVRSMMEVYALAISFQMERLEVLCLQYLESNVNLNNVLAAFTIASQMALHSFKEFCLKFIIKDCIYNQVVMSPEFESLEKPLLLEVVRSHTRSRTSCRHGLSEDLAPQAQPWGGGVPQPALSPPRRYCHMGVGDPHVPGATLEEDMRRFLVSSGDEFSDFRLTLDGTVIRTHRAVLAARSSYFEGMFRSFAPSDNQVEICIGDLVPSKASLKSLVGYIYHGDVSMPPEDSIYLLTAPAFYMFTNQRLQIFCKHNLERNVHVGNVIKILDAADKTGTTQMKRYSLDMCVKHFDKVASQPNLKTLSKDLLLDIMGAVAIDWPNANK